MAAARIDASGAFVWPDRIKRFGACIHDVSLVPRIVATQPMVLYTDTRAGYADVYLWR